LQVLALVSSFLSFISLHAGLGLVGQISLLFIYFIKSGRSHIIVRRDTSLVQEKVKKKESKRKGVGKARS
jgi:hypothetical protein